jgi:dual specificity phosphatase 12
MTMTTMGGGGGGATDERSDDEPSFCCCRILVVGADRQRVQKAISLIDVEPSLSSLLQQQDRSGGGGGTPQQLTLEFIPCVAQFDSYERTSNDDDDKNKKTMVRYLVQLKAFTADGAEPRSLLPLFDAAGAAVPRHNNNGSNSSILSFPPIAGVAIGSGIEGETDSDLIRSFVWTMMRFQDKDVTIPVATIQPNPALFATMAEEMRYYRDLSTEAKAVVTEQRTMGPGKMAAFVADFARQLIQDSFVIAAAHNKIVAAPELSSSSSLDQPSPNVSEAAAEPKPENADVNVESNNNSSNDATTSSTAAVVVVPLDRDQPLYLCRTCRTPLFGRDSLLPDHEPAQHHFSPHRKPPNDDSVAPPPPNNNNNIKCQSIFLDQALPWMGNTILNTNEGKFACPTCRTKLGGWNWSGAQCSCGTWIVPAIQIPRSRVDVYECPVTELPPGTVRSVFLSVRDDEGPATMTDGTTI